MADVPFTQGMGSPVYSSVAEGNTGSARNPLTNMANLVAAGISVALIAGVVVWGYKLMVRDVSGIPVVQAIAGEMRVRPTEAGGQLALNQGLSVNEVAADGTAAAPSDRVILAPRPITLSQEDMPVAVAVVAPVQQPEAVNPGAQPLENNDVAIDVAGALQAGSVDNLVADLTAGGSRIEADAIVQAPRVVASLDTSPRLVPVPTSAPGLKHSLRPTLRPANAPTVVVPAALPNVGTVKDVDPANVPIGTRLVQLGAFDSAEIAREQWTKLDGRFGDYLHGKSRIIQRAKSNGRVFYRLRAMGFSDLSDARRFCSALLARKADCIPVVTR